MQPEFARTSAEPATEEDANRNQRQTEDKQRRKDEKENDPKIGIRVRTADQLHQPVTDHGYAGRSGDGTAGQANWIVAEEQRRPNPVLTEFLKRGQGSPGNKKNDPPITGGSEYLLQSAEIRHDILDLCIRKLAAERLHLTLAVFYGAKFVIRAELLDIGI